MAFTPIPGGIEGTMHMLNNATGQNYANVYHWHAPGPGGVQTTDVDDVANYLATQLWPVVKTALPPSVQLVENTARNISVVNGYSKTNTANSGQVGTFGGTREASNTAVAVSWRTNAAGRRNRGRNYYGPLTTNGVIDDRLQSGLVAALFSIVSILIGTPPNGNLLFSVRSIADVLMKHVTAGVIDTVADSMRRRLLNRGR